MKTQNMFETINMMLLPHSNRTLILDNEIMLSDMDDSLNTNAVTMSMWQRNKLFKISFVIALLCEQGTMHFRLNLTEYILE